ncbi:hypothetical protein [Thalassotalea atypica]|uniref:hypothetical protein n=1 Tax=Thalassotalea atypica TaxID=2054316 RepID=UPI0025744163|nr:hypothetical protein [Thalassotalea atypica]
MALQDSNPERRNLSVLALSIIIFFLADGKFTDNTVRLQVINIDFSNPQILVVFVWGLLVWFMFRYWLIHQGEWRKDFYAELSYVPKFFYNKYLTKKFGLTNDYSRSYHDDRHWFMFDNNHGNSLKFKHIFKSEANAQLNETKDIITLGDKLLLFLCAIYIFFRKPSLSGHFVPYFLFLWACGLGVRNAL